MTTPESRSRELAAKATLGPWVFSAVPLSVFHAESGGGICEPEDDYPRGDNHPRENMEFIAFHDPSLITAYADVVEAARELVRHPWLKQHEALANAILALDSLAKDRG